MGPGNALFLKFIVFAVVVTVIVGFLMDKGGIFVQTAFAALILFSVFFLFSMFSLSKRTFVVKSGLREEETKIEHKKIALEHAKLEFEEKKAVTYARRDVIRAQGDAAVKFIKAIDGTEMAPDDKRMLMEKIIGLHQKPALSAHYEEEEEAREIPENLLSSVAHLSGFHGVDFAHRMNNLRNGEKLKGMAASEVNELVSQYGKEVVLAAWQKLNHW